MKIFVLLYADNTVLLAEGPEELQKSLNIFSQYCTIWKLKVNTNKTKVLNFGKKKKPDLHFVINNLALNIVDSYKYRKGPKQAYLPNQTEADLITEVDLIAQSDQAVRVLHR